MKLRLLFFAAFLSLASCSSDDNSTDPVNENPDPTPVEEQDKLLKKITTYTGESSPSETLFFEENKIKTRFYPDSESPNNAYLRGEYFYTENGLLDYIDSYRNETLAYKHQLTYDSSGKIITYQIISYPVDDQLDFVITINYTYLADKIIAQSDDNSPGQVYYEFYLNDLGQVNKIDTFGDIYEVTYQEGKLTSWSGNNVTILYTYDENTQLKGDYLKFYKNMFGDYEPNLVLYGAGFSFLLDSSDSYLSQESSSFETYTYQYEFDEEGYPISKLKINEGNLVEEDLIEYE